MSDSDWTLGLVLLFAGAVASVWLPFFGKRVYYMRGDAEQTQTKRRTATRVTLTLIWGILLAVWLLAVVSH